MRLLLLVLPFLFYSCAASVKGLQKHDSFTYNNLKNGKMLIAGVTNSVDDWNYKTKVNFANLLKAEIVDEREDFTVSNAGALIKNVGRKNYKTIIDEYDNDGVLSDKSLSLLSKKVKRRRYLVFAKVENDDISHNRSETNQTDSNGKELDSKKISAQTTRTLDVSFLVYDLKSKESVWSGQISQTKWEESNYIKNKDHDLVKIIEAFSSKEQEDYNKKYPYPKPTKIKTVLRSNFHGFAQNLPEED